MRYQSVQQEMTKYPNLKPFHYEGYFELADIQRLEWCGILAGKANAKQFKKFYEAELKRIKKGSKNG